MRALVFVALAVAGGCDLDAWTDAPKPVPVAKAAPPAPAPRARDDCRDTCEQNAILAQSGDDVLRACRISCEARYGAAATTPHEVPSRITRATPAHAPPAVRPR